MKRLWIIGFVLAAMLGLAFAAACDDDEDGAEDTPTTGATEPAGDETAPSGEGAVDITLQEWAVIPDPATAAAGTITFTVSNTGEEEHEFMVILLDEGETPDTLPTADDGSVDEAEVVEVVDEIEEDELQPGDTATLEVDLEAGSYALICNLVHEEEDPPEVHYALGMRAGFEVTE